MQRRSWRQKIQHHPFIATGGMVALTVLIVCGFVVHFGWDWTGFNGGYDQIMVTSTSQGITTTTVRPPSKTLWDWLQLFIVPIILAVGGFWLNQIQKDREEKATIRREEIARKIARDNQQETTLQAYLDNISQLLLNEHLRDSKTEDEVRKIARVRTLTVLQRLDAERKFSVLLFLHEAGLIEKGKCIVELDIANLQRADLRGIHLEEAQLRGAKLQGADLSSAYLSGTDLKDANLHGTNLRGTDLRETYLEGVDLGEANLRETNLKGATVTLEQLDKTKSLQGAIMPDGKRHPS